jgi:UDP:flavonoid glycosyltransferase YjiC (YdhE family)
MSRILFATWPFDGHLLPQLSIARALSERRRLATAVGEMV